ncbi:methyl-accepting chemotaxis protein [Pelagirhabdus alkalitolerans]|uniref:Methyl-accepting chemotaxis protein n=1 Tax=Pelagirhabdus alkalitolerans TaxID=1612202 RepID=A0A1G6KLJ4_9BACI|nr:HAMP domain-containing methyl-accepting chemotaxis protein [Pelagirhabdus alkalitolerans]SDC31833.1 methyl-accepting chemotaxis protein [Pelagirhabdus alkalitolerans]
MKITGKLMASSIAMVIVLIVTGVVAIMSLSVINQNATEMYEDRVEPLNDLNEMTRLAENTRVNMVTATLERDASYTEVALDNMALIDEYIESYQEAPLTSEEEAEFNVFQEEWAAFEDIVNNNIRLLNNGQYSAAQSGIRDGGTHYTPASEQLAVLNELSNEQIEALSDENTQAYNMNLLIVIVTLAIATVIAILIGLIMGRNIGRPLNQVATELDQVANGDLTGEALTTKRKDEIGMLYQATNTMRSNVKGVLEQINKATKDVLTQANTLSSSSQEVKEGSKQIATTMEELSDGAESQANHATTLTETMDAFLTKIKEADHVAKNTNEEAIQVSKLSEEGAQSMNNSVQTMNDVHTIVKNAVEKVRLLDQESKQISKLVEVVSDIAEQTNLLALNAAIEAARAGEDGKGFAVVADEVRKLAEQVATSINEITQISDRIQEGSDSVAEALETGYQHVNQGSEQIDKTGELFNDMHQSYDAITAQLANISNELNHVVKNTDEMHRAIEDIASVSEESAAGVEETAASSEESLSSMEEITNSAEGLKQLADQLEAEVNRFKLS